MRSVIYEYTNKTYPHEIMLWMWSYSYMNMEIRENAKQLIRTLDIEHTQERWDEKRKLSAAELLETLRSIKRKNEICVLYYN